MRVSGLVVIAVMLVGCGGGSQQARNGEIKAVSPPSSPTAQPSSSKSSAVSSSDSGIAENATPGPDAGTLADRVNRLRQRPDSDPSATPPPLAFRPAAENSRVAVTMEDDGSVLEVRIFDGHPQLARVEARPQASGPTRFKIFLKNGRTVAAKSDKIPNLLTATSSQFLELAGISSRKPDRPRIANENR